MAQLTTAPVASSADFVVFNGKNSATCSALTKQQTPWQYPTDPILSQWGLLSDTGVVMQRIQHRVVSCIINRSHNTDVNRAECGYYRFPYWYLEYLSWN